MPKWPLGPEASFLRARLSKESEIELGANCKPNWLDESNGEDYIVLTFEGQGQPQSLEVAMNRTRWISGLACLLALPMLFAPAVAVRAQNKGVQSAGGGAPGMLAGMGTVSGTVKTATGLLVVP